jgi:tight adherence protein B
MPVTPVGLLAGVAVLVVTLVAGVAHGAVSRGRSRRVVRPLGRPDAAPSVLRWRWAAALLAPSTAAVLAGPGLAVITAAGCAAAPVVARHLRRQRDADRFEAAVPAMLEAVARALRTGVTLGQALAEVAADGPPPLRADLAAVAARARQGEGLVPALEGWGNLRPDRSVRLAVAALCLGAETGGAQARAVDGVAATLRQRQAAAAEARALATQARASAAVIALAPIAFCALASSTDPRVSTFLFRSPAGVVVLATGLSLDAIGAWWMARLTRLPA